jgi:queuine tRNA-ribosyltransferase
MLKFTIDAKVPGGRARAGRIETPHGVIETPAFIPVGTKATVKALSPEQVRDDVGAQAILANTYHLYLQPGVEVLRKAGGLGKFMDWSGPTFTDSGGFQAFSLGLASGKRKGKISFNNSEIGDQNSEFRSLDSDLSAIVDDDGVTFKSVIDGSTHRFTPERSIEIQHAIGADIIFAFDECILPGESYERQKQAVERTSLWAERCLTAHSGREQALFGIVQGGRYEDLRKLSAKQIGGTAEGGREFEGFGIGGSFDKDDIGTAVGWVADGLPENKPRHLLGIGSEPSDLILGIENGMDTFDCVAPTRIARNGSVYVKGVKGLRGSAKMTIKKMTVNLLNAAFIEDFSPIDATCGCYTCKNYTRAYLAHLFRAKEMFAATLASIHNLYFVVNLVKEARESIIGGTFKEWLRHLGIGVR